MRIYWKKIQIPIEYEEVQHSLHQVLLVSYYCFVPNLYMATATLHNSIFQLILLKISRENTNRNEPMKKRFH